MRNIRGILASRRILKQFNPQLALMTGGYVTAPMSVATWITRTPAMLFSPDIEPGKAVLFASRMADCTIVPVPEAQSYYSARVKTVVTGYPIRSEVRKWSREEARARIGLGNNKPVLLVLGGSKGARSINRALVVILPKLLDDFQVIHISGTLDWPEVQKARSTLQPHQASQYHIFPYLHEDMGAALASADLAISRAGASILGEYPHFGLPAILIPYPHSWRYQTVNATYLENKGAAVTLPDSDLQSRLLALIYDITGQPERLETMNRAMRRLQPDPPAARRIADIARQIAQYKKAKDGYYPAGSKT